jgi:hypothetical protein
MKSMKAKRAVSRTGNSGLTVMMMMWSVSLVVTPSYDGKASRLYKDELSITTRRNFCSCMGFLVMRCRFPRHEGQSIRVFTYNFARAIMFHCIQQNHL